jgi:ATP-dependent Clp protease protease subunit
MCQGYRYSMPHSILMMHHPSGASRGQASEMHIESRELVRVRDYLSLVISDSTGQPYDRVSSWSVFTRSYAVLLQGLHLVLL